MPKGRVLVVEDEAGVAAFTASCLERAGFKVTDVVSTTERALQKASDDMPDVVLMDIGLNCKSDGIEAAKEIRSNYDIPIIFLTSSADDRTIERAKVSEPIGYVLKPFKPEELQATLETALYQYRASRTRSEEAVRYLEHKYQAIFNNAMEGIFQCLPGGQMITANPALARMLGYESPDEFLPTAMDVASTLYLNPAQHRKLVKLLKDQGFVRKFETEFRRKDGQSIRVSITARTARDPAGKICHYDGMVEDITERRRLEQQVRQAQKLEAVGQLAAGIAHEINTPTQYVGDNTRFLKDAFSDLKNVLQAYERLLQAHRDEETISPELIQEVEKAVEVSDLEYLTEEIPKAISQTLEGVGRIASIVKAMKEFSHPGTSEKEPTDLRRAIESTIIVSRNEYKYVAEMETDFDESLPLVPCFPGDFNQVILNLIVNASHAIADSLQPDSGQKGAIRLSAHRAGDWAEIRISDSGTGIPEKARSRIFEPFFTTKEVGKGTGQGLALAHSVIVGKHGGTLDFETEMGKGTTFIIRLPIEDRST